GTVKRSALPQLTPDHAPASIDGYNRQRQITINAGLDRIVLGEAVARIREAVGELNLKPGYSLVFSGGAKQLSDASSDFGIAVLLAIIFIYMVLASQFNSFVHPLTIMTALPLSLPAGLFALMIFGM